MNPNPMKRRKANMRPRYSPETKDAFLDAASGVLWIAAMIAVPALVVLGIAWQVSK